MNKSSDFKHDRRQWLKASAAIVSAAVLPVSGEAAGTALPASPPTHEGPLAGAAADAGDNSPAPFFTPAQHALVEELSETVIPADGHSGGAKAANVADFTEQTLHGSVDDQQRELWKEGLRLMDLMSQHYNGKSFIDASPEERAALFQVLSDNADMTEVPEVAFFHELKKLTIQGYYTSKIGIHDELEYKGNRILMEYVGCDDPVPPSK